MTRRATAAAVALAGVAGVSLLIAGCAPGGNGGGQQTSQPVSTDIASMGDVTISVLDFWQDDPWMAAAVEGFEAKYPNVTIDRTSEEWGQVIDTLNLRLSEDGGPDIATVNNGWSSLGTLVEGGLVLNLDDYAKAYGWNDEIPSTVLRQSEFTSDGSEMGTGSLYSLPVARSALIGLYYNEDLLNQVGATVPTNLAEFEDACAKLAAAGITPIAYGSVDKGSSTAILWAAQDMFGSAGSINDFVYSSGGVTAADTGLGDAATTVKQWADNGWFTPSFEGVQYNDALDAFSNGQAAFRFEYTGTVFPEGHTFGYAQLGQKGGDIVATGSSSGILSISSKSKNPDVAAAFLDYLASQEAAQTAIEVGLLPMLHSDLDVSGVSSVFATEIEGQQAVEADDGYVPYFDWSTSSMLDTVGSSLQELYAGRITPDQLVQAAQADYDAFQSR
jgi:raffinose/stachyose/melibiose transport system substrate-binding protein